MQLRPRRTFDLQGPRQGRSARLARQTAILHEIDRLKAVQRATPAADGLRLEAAGGHRRHNSVYNRI
ncbi:MAG: hypothetical protein ACC631_08390, partial [Halocynthiibacter sp.]